MIFLRNATYVDWQTLDIKPANIIVEPGKIQLVANDFTPKQPFEEIDCTGKIVTKSFVVGHHHAYSALSRGMGAPKHQPSNFYEILKYIWWTLDKCLTPEMVELSGLVTAIACAKAGATFAIDHHASPFAIKNSLRILAKAFETVGVAHLLCYEISDRDGYGIAMEGLSETEQYLKEHQGLVGLHASFTLSDDTLHKASKLCEVSNSGIHIHVAEGISDQEHCQQTYNKRVVERLNDFGLLNSPKSILVHCLHLSDTERKLIASSPCWVTQNTDSNLNNNVGYFSGKGLGNNIMLGTDGMHSDMLHSLQSAYFVGQNHDPMNPTQAYQRLRNAHRYLASNGFSGDDESNLVVLDYLSPTPITSNNFCGHLLFGMNSANICDVIANGKLIVRNRKITTVNEQEIMHESQKLALKLWEKMNK